MALDVGSRLGHYDVTALIGEGGMGQVYQATDTKLNRQVALKILPEAFASDPDRLARFQREAHVLASLNHPNIAAIYGLEESGDTRALVLELVEGPTLADRIAQGAIPLDEALPIAKQIAEALEAAHEAGVIHRDLKPANIKVRDDGTVKVLDFGLAKALDTTPQGDPSLSPTLTAAATQMGVIMGTAAYMSPEQARGKPVDKRADIWAFGAVLFEMLTGQRAFPGGDLTDTIAAVVRSEPPWDALPGDTTPRLNQILRACLQKDRARRVRDIGDVQLAMEGVFETSANDLAEPPTIPQLRVWQRPVPLTLAALGLIVVTGLAVWGTSRPADAPQSSVTRLPLDIGPTNVIGASFMHAMLAVSPDGTQLAYSSRSRLFLRPLGELETQRLAPNASVVWSPFFSPDGRSIGFFDSATRELKRVSVQGGPSEPLAEGVLAGDGTWLPDSTIIFSGGPGRVLARIPETGGTPEPLSTLDDDERAHLNPHTLPGGTHILLTTVSDTPRVAVLSLETREHHIVVENGYDARYVATGHLIFGRGGALWGVPFDLDRLDTSRSEQMLLPDVSGGDSFRLALAASDDGSTLVYLRTAAENAYTSSLVWVNRNGQPERIPRPDAVYHSPTVLPDGDGIAYLLLDALGRASNWTLDLQTNVPQQLAIEGYQQSRARWSPDGRFVFARFEDGNWNIYLGSAESPAVTPLTDTDDYFMVPTWSANGEWVVFTAQSGATRDRDIWVVRADGSEDPQPLIATAAREEHATVSPTGQWIAYTSYRSGQPEILVEPFPPSGELPRTVSASGGTEPVWSKDGRELYYRTDDELMAVPVSAGPEFEPGRPVPLFEDHFSRRGYAGPTSTYDVARDGRFLMVDPAEGDGTSLVVVLNWFEELKRLVPTE